MDEPLGCLFQLLWLPFRTWAAISERSLVGASEMDREAGRFWKNFAIIGTILLLAVAALIIWWT
jgi:hypothetical protein